ncbi:MAG TPA: hypothetical protein VGD99_13260 [Anaerolineae bacterium]
MTIFKIIRPYLIRYLAKSAAGYLETRRVQRLQRGLAETIEPETRVYSETLPAREVVWYTLSGVLLGSAFGLILAVLFRPTD